MHERLSQFLEEEEAFWIVCNALLMLLSTPAKLRVLFMAIEINN